MIRVATLDDIPAMIAIRSSVRENPLTRSTIGHDAYVRALTVDGRAWVYVDDATNEIAGFACGRLAQRDIWGLFLHAAYEGRGIGSALLAVVEAWMFENGVEQIELTTDPGTRAERLYRRRGWRSEGLTADGELRFVLQRVR